MRPRRLIRTASARLARSLPSRHRLPWRAKLRRCESRAPMRPRPKRGPGGSTNAAKGWPKAEVRAVTIALTAASAAKAAPATAHTRAQAASVITTAITTTISAITGPGSPALSRPRKCRGAKGPRAAISRPIAGATAAKWSNTTMSTCRRVPRRSGRQTSASRSCRTNGFARNNRSLNCAASKALADQVELVERCIAHGDRARAGVFIGGDPDRQA